MNLLARRGLYRWLHRFIAKRLWRAVKHAFLDIYRYDAVFRAIASMAQRVWMYPGALSFRFPVALAVHPIVQGLLNLHLDEKLIKVRTNQAQGAGALQTDAVVPLAFDSSAVRLFDADSRQRLTDI